MTRRSTSRKLMIMDACVLIDFIKAERAVLELVVKHIGPLHVTSPVVEEVKEMSNPKLKMRTLPASSQGHYRSRTGCVC